ncbi:MAG: hypothetical protein ACRED1_14140 [Limisphaerales bacterium]
MKAYKIVESGGLWLRAVDLPEPQAGPGQIVIRVRVLGGELDGMLAESVTLAVTAIL